MADVVERFWKVVGGVSTDGIIVRAGREIQSHAASQRLSTGAVVKQLELVGERLRYTLASGEGPQEGWVSVRSKDKELAIPCAAPSREPKAQGLKDPAFAAELEAEEVTIEGLKAIVRRRPEGSPKAPFAVLMLPGNPVVNSYNANMALPMAVDKAFGEAGFPVVRFDWDGTGMNAPGTHPPTQGYEATIPDTWKMYEYALQLGEHICVCSWNYSGTIASKMALEKWPQVSAIVSLSFAYKQWEFVARFVNEWAGHHLKQEFEDHSKLEVPCLYVFGDKDVHTPREEVQRIVDARPDGGAGAEICVISQADQKLISTQYFMMKDKEDEAAYKCASWLSDLRKALEDAQALWAGA